MEAAVAMEKGFLQQCSTGSAVWCKLGNFTQSVGVKVSVDGFLSLSLCPCDEVADLFRV